MRKDIRPTIPDPAAYQFQDREGKWHCFTDQKHYENTVADGSWPIRKLYTEEDMHAYSIACMQSNFRHLDQLACTGSNAPGQTGSLYGPPDK